MSVVIEVNAAGIDAAVARINRLLDAGQRRRLMEQVAGIGANQTRRRIEEEKTAPSGEAWKPNRRGGSILLESGRHLRDRIGASSTGDTAEWGANWEYAMIHQAGATITPKNGKALKVPLPDGSFRLVKSVTIPARPWLGLSDDNRREIVDLAEDWMRGLLQ